jgi:hypothetical protein
MEKKCRICKKVLGKKFKVLGTPFYAKETKVCEECYKDCQEKINLKI